jgi:hypothetical protein
MPIAVIANLPIRWLFTGMIFIYTSITLLFLPVTYFFLVKEILFTDPKNIAKKAKR